MKKEKIVFNPFSDESIKDAIAKIKHHQRSLEAKIDLFTEKLAEQGVYLAKEKVTMYDAIFTADLINSIHLEPRNDGMYAIVSDSEHTAFVEFGTGQMGQEGSYPYTFPEGVTWEYNTGKTIFQIADGQYGWFYPALDGTWKFTQGMPSRPFMYETALDLNDMKIIKKVAKEVFG